MICANEKCGKEFEPRWHSQKYCCKECGNKVNSAKSNNKQKLKRESEKTKERKKSTIAIINAKARKKHLSYGQYVAQYM